MEWLRWYHGAISDPKWPLIARKSGQNIGTVVSIWVALLEYASQGDDHGQRAVSGLARSVAGVLPGGKEGGEVGVGDGGMKKAPAL